jgi:bifunctional ADP-heptose synthase (sugar kinase/adenylyltransferase)
VIVSEPQLIAAITRDHAAGKRIGFVRASFDLLRLDVVRMLQASAAKSDRLVVAVIDDAGDSPVLSVQDRAELVDGLRGVDYAIICANGEVDRLMALLAPYVT